jgi:hypothetical protein
MSLRRGREKGLEEWGCRQLIGALLRGSLHRVSCKHFKCLQGSVNASEHDQQQETYSNFEL